MRSIHLGGKYGAKAGRYALVDDKDFDELNKKKWFARKGTSTFYAVRTEGWHTPKRTVRMHRIVLGLEDNQIQVDHKDTNGLNNQRINLRIATKRENQHNRGLPKNNTSGYKGVCWYEPYQKWKAHSTEWGCHVHLGYFEDKIDAAKAYDERAKKIHGEFARLNFPLK